MLRITSSLCSFALDCDSPAITNMIIQTANLFPFFKQRNKTTQAYMQEPTTRKKHRYQTWGQFASAVFRHSKWIFPEMKHGVQAAKRRCLHRLSTVRSLWRTETCGKLDPAPTGEPCGRRPETHEMQHLWHSPNQDMLSCKHQRLPSLSEKWCFQTADRNRQSGHHGSRAGTCWLPGEILTQRWGKS